MNLPPAAGGTSRHAAFCCFEWGSERKIPTGRVEPALLWICSLCPGSTWRCRCWALSSHRAQQEASFVSQQPGAMFSSQKLRSPALFSEQEPNRRPCCPAIVHRIRSETPSDWVTLCRCYDLRLYEMEQYFGILWKAEFLIWHSISHEIILGVLLSEGPWQEGKHRDRNAESMKDWFGFPPPYLHTQGNLEMIIITKRFQNRFLPFPPMFWAPTDQRWRPKMLTKEHLEPQ